MSDLRKESLETKLARYIAGPGSSWYEESIEKDREHNLSRKDQWDESIRVRRRQDRWTQAQRSLRRNGVGFVGLVAVRTRLDEERAGNIADSLLETDMTGQNIDIAIGGLTSVSITSHRRQARTSKKVLKNALQSQETDEFDISQRQVEVFPTPLKPRRVDLLDMAKYISFNESLMCTRGDVIAHLVVVTPSDAMDFGARPNQQDLGRLQIIDRIGPDYGDISWRTV